MTAVNEVLDQLRDDVRRTSLGGFPMLIAAATAWAIAAALTYVLPLKVAALVFLFQGVLTMPFGLWLLPKWMGLSPLPRDHALTPLLIQCAAVQSLMLPAIIAVFSLRPQLVPLAFAAIMGGHFLPYWWIQRSKAYLWGAIISALGPWFLTMVVGAQRSFHFTGFFVAAVLAGLAFTVRRQVRRGITS
jgi:hypothetical protein